MSLLEYNTYTETTGRGSQQEWKLVYNKAVDYRKVMASHSQQDTRIYIALNRGHIQNTYIQLWNLAGGEIHPQHEFMGPCITHAHWNVKIECECRVVKITLNTVFTHTQLHVYTHWSIVIYPFKVTIIFFYFCPLILAHLLCHILDTLREGGREGGTGKGERDRGNIDGGRKEGINGC